jgi:GntR family transcriptional repressor for pyruvate dehydrogenase complex
MSKSHGDKNEAGAGLFGSMAGRPDMVDLVVDKVTELIASNKLKPGDRLPPEASVGSQMGVSRTVVREAMRVLAARGLVETKHGVGTLVKSNRGGQLAGPLSSMIQREQISIEDVHGVRAILEVEIAGIAAERASRAEVAELEKRVDELERSAGSTNAKDYVRADGEFHRYLAKISHNPLLVTLLDSVSELLAAIRLSVMEYPELYKPGVADHRRIMERVKAKDAPGARAAMRKHIERAKKILQDAASR